MNIVKPVIFEVYPIVVLYIQSESLQVKNVYLMKMDSKIDKHGDYFSKILKSNSRFKIYN